MNILNFIIKSFWFFKKQHLAVFAGTVISTAVLTGALIVGDSIKYSLKQTVDARLGNIKFAMQTGDRFVRAELANDISTDLNIATSPLLMLESIAINTESNIRINKTQIYGINDSFWALSSKTIPKLNEDEVIISENIAQKLNLNINDEFLLRVENTDIIPLNAPFAKESDPSVALRVKVMAIADNENLGRFSLKNIQSAPYNIFISREYLAKKLELVGLANIIISSDNKEQNLKAEDLNKSLSKVWQTEDANIIIRELDDIKKHEILSDRIFIDEPIWESIKDFAIPKETIITYLVNTIRFNGIETPYSFVTATSSPLLPSDLKENEIIINQWLSSDLKISQNDTIEIEYFTIGALRTLTEVRKQFIVKDIIPTQGKIANKSLMPLFPGLADAGSCSDWETGIPIDLDRIRGKDEKYWDDYNGTPKALISIQTGLNIWQNKYGSYTSIRFNQDDISTADLKKEILKKLKPEYLNLSFLNVQSEGVRAATNGVDFGELFLSMSFFIIVAGILLTVLIYSLNTESRTKETGILSAIGFNNKQVIQIRFAENFLTAIFGGIVGVLVGIWYNNGIMFALNTIWQDIVRTNILLVHIKPLTLIIGAIGGTIISLIAIYFVTRNKLKQVIIGLVREISQRSPEKAKSRAKFNKLTALVSILIVIVLISYSFSTSVDQNAGLILSAGGIFLLSCIAMVNLIFNKVKQSTSGSTPTIVQFALKNASRNKSRSLAIIALLALGTFTIIITGANRNTFSGNENIQQSGTGGFLFWAESTLPILYDLNSETGKNRFGFEGEADLENVEFIQMHQLDGDDASCLNLNQVQKPKILGINPEELNKRDAFSFAKLLEGINKENTWLELNKSSEKNVYYAFADQTVITWGLIKEVGDTLIYLNEAGQEIYLVLIGGLNASIFQGNILIADEVFMQNFPSISGSKTMLIDGPVNNKEEISELISTYLRNYGIELNLTSDRLAQFYSVTNTYLTVFMFLGGLGVIIGTFGLGIVLMRNIIERRSEIALLLAVGFSKNKVFKLIFIENILLLILGIGIGIFAAIIGILPSIFSPAFSIPGFFVLILVLLVLISGMLWIYFPSRNAIKSNLISSLRNE
jgi:putative ABC transport system permease protein